jgi:hypothetical protein
MAVTFTSTPDEIAWSRHPLNFVVISDDAEAYANVAFKFELWKVAAGGDIQIGKTTNPIKADATKAAAYNFSQLLSDELKYDMPVLAQLGNTNANVTAEYYVKCIEVISKVDQATYTSANHYALRGANDFFYNTRQYLAIDVTKNYIWLTAKPVERELFWEQEEIISVLFTADQVAPQLDIKLFYDDATDYTINTVLADVVKGEVLNYDLSNRLGDYNQYNLAKTIIRIEVEFNTLTGVAVNQNDSKKLTYKLIGKVSPNYRDYHFYNRYGGLDCLPATGQCNCEDLGKGEKFRTDDNMAEEIASETVDYFTQSSGFIPKSDRLAYTHLREIRKAWYVMATADYNLNAIAITPQKTLFDKDNTNVLGFAFEYTFGNGRQNFDLINATEFTPEGDMALPIEMTDVTGLVAALLAKQPTEAGKGLSQENFTTTLKNKLDALSDNFRGKHATGAALDIAYPAPANDSWAIVEDTDTVWVWDVDGSAWVDTGSSSPHVELINDLVTGGTGKAATAETVKTLKALVDALLKLAELDTLNFGTNTAAWDYNNQVLVKAKATITANLVTIASNDADVKEITYILTVTNSPEITLPDHHFTAAEIDLLDDVAWDAGTEKLTISNGAATRYIIMGTWDDVALEYICNIQKK